MSQQLTKTNSHLTLKERLALKRQNESTRKCLLLDLSSSMNYFADSDFTSTRLDNLKKALAPVKSRASHIYSFATNSFRVDPTQLDHLTAYGSTRLLPALELMIEDQIKHGVVITDGEIGDISSVLDYLKQHPEIRLEIIYVGGRDTKPDSLDQIAALCGTYCDSIEISEPKALESKLQLLLEHPRETGDRTIKL